VPNPTLDLRRGTRLRVRFEEPVGASMRVCLGVRETGINVPVGQDGGTSGAIEWVGVSDVGDGVPQGMLIPCQPGRWQTLTFFPYPEQVKGYTGDGVLSAAGHRGVLEHVALTADDSAGPFTVYFDSVTQPCWPRGDFDHDGDVDQSDFAHLQLCLSGENVFKDDADCFDARLDNDLDVGDLDVSQFLLCLSGPNALPPPYCFPD